MTFGDDERRKKKKVNEANNTSTATSVGPNAAALRKLNEEMGLTIVITEQNVNFAMNLAQEIHLLETGKIRLSGTPDELMQETYIKETYFGG